MLRNFSLVQCMVHSISKECRTCTEKPTNDARSLVLVPYSISKRVYLHTVILVKNKLITNLRNCNFFRLNSF